MLNSTEEIREITKEGQGSIDATFDELIWESNLYGLGVRGIYFWHAQDCYIIQRDGDEFAHHNMVYLFDGRLRMETLSHDVEVTPGQLLTFPSRIPRRLSMTSKSAIGMHLRIDDDAGAVKFPELSVFDSSESEAIRSVINQVMREREGRSMAHVEALKQLTSLLAIYVERDLQILKRPGSQYHREQLNELWMHVRRDLARSWTVEQLAKGARVSPSYLFQLCRDLYGAAPMAYVNRLRIDQAKSLLKLTSLELAEIAEKVGYASPYAFSDAFHRRTGIRPGRFRKMNAGA